MSEKLEEPTEVAPLSEPETVATSKLKPSARNARKIPKRAVEMVAKSLRQFGWQQPIVASRDGEILVGHTRHQAAKLLRLKHVPVVWFDGTEEEARAYRIADNRTADFSSWDFPELARELDDLGPQWEDVLGVADWAAILDDYDEATGDLGAGGEEFDSKEASGGFDVVVTFESREAALAAELKIFDEVEGVVDIRHKRG
jgi:hypothetical protein